jgi:hypothetical protein
MRMNDLSDEQVEIHRFFCGCGSPQHVLEICIEDGQVIIEYYHGQCNFGLWDRIKTAFALVFGNYERPWSDFIIKDEDREEIARLIGVKNEVQ